MCSDFAVNFVCPHLCLIPLPSNFFPLFLIHLPPFTNPTYHKCKIFGLKHFMGCIIFPRNFLFVHSNYSSSKFITHKNVLPMVSPFHHCLPVFYLSIPLTPLTHTTFLLHPLFPPTCSNPLHCPPPSFPLICSSLFLRFGTSPVRPCVCLPCTLGAMPKASQPSRR